MSTFRDAIMDAAAVEGYDNPRWSFGSVTDAILATPEMKAIRKALRDECHTCCADCFRDWARHHNLPESVIDWVVEDQ